MEEVEEFLPRGVSAECGDWELVVLEVVGAVVVGREA